MKNIKFLSLIAVFALLFTSCEIEETPTKVLMQGTWELTEALDADGNDITNKLAFPVTVIQLTDDNGMLGTQGPMFTHIVYGGSKWIEVSAKIKQVFDYANFRFNSGEFFLEAGTTDRFTVEAKLQATAAAGGLKDILQIFNIDNAWLQQVIYHRFINVKVDLPKMENTKERNIMTWEFDDLTTATYNYKDSQGNNLLWGGWPVDRFTKGVKFTFQKRVKGLNEIVQERL
jgi:hypothetical protein